MSSARARARGLFRRLGGLSPDYEPNVRRIVDALVHNGSVCADVGANVGLITEALARRVGSTGHVVAFEPHPANVEAIHHLLARRRLSERVTVRAEAVSDGTVSSVWLYAGRGDSPSEWNIVGHDVEGRATEAAFEVPAVSLDEAFPEGRQLDFVKIDVEGAEPLVLAGMTRLLRQVRPALLVEFHDEEGWASRRVLLGAGYQIYDTQGRAVPDDADRVYHCVALPDGSAPPFLERPEAE